MAHAHDQERPGPEKRRRRPGPTASARDETSAELEKLQQGIGNAAMSRMLDPRASQAIESELGGGQPLSEATTGQRPPQGGANDQAEAEEVRVHDDSTAAEVSKELGAVAFTFGRDIFLAGDAPELESPEGQRVLRHELTHVRQQADTHPGRPRKVSSPTSPAEREAAHAGDHGTSGTAPSPAGAVHRQEEDELMEMPAETVHRQEEEEGEEIVATMPAETVHRQEEEEGEEIVLTMPAETVHRQEELPEEELAMMPAETVHRQEEDTAEAVVPQNAALAALFEATVVAKLEFALESMENEPPNGYAAHGALVEAVDALRPLHAAYTETDPHLKARLGTLGNGILVARNALGPYLGINQGMGSITGNIGAARTMAHEMAPDLH